MRNCAGVNIALVQIRVNVLSLVFIVYSVSTQTNLCIVRKCNEKKRAPGSPSKVACDPPRKMVLTRAQRKRLQQMVDEVTDSSVVESLQPTFEYVAPARPKKARRAAILPSSLPPSESGADDRSQLEVCQTPMSTVTASPLKPVGAVGGIGALMTGDLMPAISNFEFTHTMTYNTCSNLATASDVIGTGDDVRPSDLSKCTCYFRNLRSFIDLPPHFGYGANANRAAGMWSMAPKRMTCAVAATSCLAMGVYCWQHGALGAGKALVSSTAEAHPAPHFTLWAKFWTTFYGYLKHMFYD